MADGNQGKNQPDDPRQAPEEGDVQATGRSRGHVVDRTDPLGPTRTAPDNPSDKGSDKANEKSEHWESGRQRST
jgi:hypothetical protein